jgi:hypothetical protein
MDGPLNASSERSRSTQTRYGDRRPTAFAAIGMLSPDQFGMAVDPAYSTTAFRLLPRSLTSISLPVFASVEGGGRIRQALALGSRMGVLCEPIGVGRDQKFMPASLYESLAIGDSDYIRDEVEGGKVAIRRVARTAEVRSSRLLQGGGDGCSRRQAGVCDHARRRCVTRTGRVRPRRRGASDQNKAKLRGGWQQNPLV